MLNENIKLQRKAKGMSQEELAAKLNVVRQTLSKWENGLSVPDAEMLIRIAEALDTSVSELLGESCPSESNSDTLKILAVKLEVLNQQYSRSQEQKRKIWRIVFIALAILGAIYLVDCLRIAGIIFRAIINPNVKVVSDSTKSMYIMMFSSCVRIILPPVVVCVIAANGVYKTKENA